MLRCERRLGCTVGPVLISNETSDVIRMDAFDILIVLNIRFLRNDLYGYRRDRNLHWRYERKYNPILGCVNVPCCSSHADIGSSAKGTLDTRQILSHVSYL